MRLFNLEDIGPHYANTLLHWRHRFAASSAEIKSLGYPEEFVRMWDFYFCYSAGGFMERVLGDAHMVFVKPGNRINWDQLDFCQDAV